MKRVAAAAVCVVALVTSVASALNIPVATRSRFTPMTSSTVYFDRNGNRPADVGGVPGEMKSRTVVDCALGFTYTYTTSVPNSHCCICERNPVTLRIDSFHIAGRQAVTVYLPKDVSKALRVHEDNHVRIGSYSYTQAVGRSNNYARNMLGRCFTADSENDAKGQIEDAFKNEYSKPFIDWTNAMHQTYNDLVSDPNAPKVGTEAAYAQAVSRP